jgi:hypothetical protein
LLQATIYDQHNMDREGRKYLSNTKKKRTAENGTYFWRHDTAGGQDEGLMAGRFWRFHGMVWGLNWSREA